MKTWAERILATRGRMGLSQSQFAERLQVEEMTVSKWERGLHVPRGKMMRAAIERLEMASKGGK